MERFIADLVKRFETGNISRRDFCEGVALAATVYAAGATANAAPKRPQDAGVNHISIPARLPQGARFLQLRAGHGEMKDDGKARVNLAFGRARQGGSFIVARNVAANAPAPARAVVDHVCYTLPNWDDARVNAALKAKGQNPTGRSGSVNVFDRQFRSSSLPRKRKTHSFEKREKPLWKDSSPRAQRIRARQDQPSHADRNADPGRHHGARRRRPDRGASRSQGRVDQSHLLNLPQFQAGGDWYSKVFNLDQVGLKETE